MTDLARCIRTALSDPELGLDRDRAERAIADFEDRVARRRLSGLSEPDARAAAAEETIESVLARARSNRHATVRQLEQMKRNQARYAHADADQPLKDLEWAEKETRALEKSFMRSIHDFLKEHRTDLLGRVRGRALLKDVLKELHGESSGNAAAQAIGQAILKTYERARALANANGMDIAKLADFGVPHAHDARRVLSAGFREWADFVYDRADWSRIVNHETGKPFAVAKGAKPFREDADRFLEEVYQSITTNGWHDRFPSMGRGARALFNQRTEHRVLHFNSSDDWWSYNDAFGQSNPFEAVIGHLRGMARDIALMRNFGPNPKSGLEHALQIIERRDTLAGGKRAFALRDRTAAKAKKARIMMRILSGEANVPDRNFWASFFAGTRNVLTAAQLGSASLSQVTDLVSMTLAARAVGLNGSSPLLNTFKNIFGGMDQKAAQDLGFILDTWFDAGSGQARFMGDIWQPELTNRITNFVLRANGLSFLTDRSRAAVAASFGSDLADLAEKGFADLPERLRVFMENRGIGAREWDAVRDPRAIYTDAAGGRHVNAEWFRENTDLPASEAEDIAIRWGALVQDHMEYAIPTASLRGRATLLGDSKPGSFIGELARSGIMYKSYTLSVMFNQLRRLAELPGNFGTRALYATGYVTFMTAMGALAVQLKEIAKGRDPRPMTTLQFWGAAALQGGGVGIFGDFFSASTSRAGGGFAETLAGPVAGVAGDVSRAVGSNIARAAEGKPILLGRDIANLARRYNPLATFQPLVPVPTRLALDRMLWDQLQLLLDPEAKEQFAAAEGRQRRANGVGYYWRPGEPLPRRGPSLATVAGGGAP